MPDARILLLQARYSGDPAIDNERASFARAAEVPLEQVRSHSLLDGPPTLAVIRDHQAVMIGGAGEFLVSKADLPRFDSTLERLTETVEAGQPMFASCFGFQLLVKALGGEIIFDQGGMEAGTYDLELTSSGAGDPIFGALPRVFQAQLGRKDRAARLPDNTEHLAGSQAAPYQALRITDKPVWATQFHPELTGAENLARYRAYLETYAAHMTTDEITASIARFGESPDTIHLIGRFMRWIDEKFP
jgi:GMP synthase (glutamine-hydrolysing)